MKVLTPSVLAGDRNPGGADTQVQYNSSGSLAGSADLTWDDTAKELGVGGNIAVPSGSQSAPSLTFTGDPNTGIYSPGGDQLALSTNGTGRLFVDANGNVGIKTSPNAPFHVKTGAGGGATPNTYTKALLESSDRAYLEISSATTGLGAVLFSDDVGSRGSIFYDHNDDHMRLGTAGTERARIDSSGNVGIGTSAPSDTCHVVGSFRTDDLKINNNQIGAADVGGGLLLAPHVTNIDVAGGDIDITTGNAGTRNGGTGDINIFSADATNQGSGSINLTTGDQTGAAPAGAINLTAGNSSYSGGSTGGQPGSVFIKAGDHSSNTNLNKFGGSVFIRAGYNSAAAAYSGDISLQYFNGTSYLDALTVKGATGAVGIGTTSPGNRLEVGGEASPRLAINSTGNGTPGVLFQGAGTTYGSITENISSGQLAIKAGASGQNSYFITFGTNDGTEKARIDSSGRLLVGTSSTSEDTFLRVQGNATTSTATGGISLSRGSLPTGSNSGIGAINFSDNNGNQGAQIVAIADGAWTSGSNHRTRLVFSTTADGAASPTERMRIDSSGGVTIGNSVLYSGETGAVTGATGTTVFSFDFAGGSTRYTHLIKIFVMHKVETNNISSQPAAEYVFAVEGYTTGAAAATSPTAVFENVYVAATHFAFASTGSTSFTITLTNPSASASSNVSYRVEILGTPSGLTLTSVATT